MQFVLYLDKIIERIELQKEAYSKEEGIPVKLYELYDQQKANLEQLKEKHGARVLIDKLV